MEENGEQIQETLQWFAGEVQQAGEKIRDGITDQLQRDAEDYTRPVVAVKSAPSTESNFGIVLGAGVAALAISAFALYKKSRKAPVTSTEALLNDEEFEKV